MSRIENGKLVKNKLTGCTGIIIDNGIRQSQNPIKMEIYYIADNVPVCNLIGETLFNYAGKTCFRKYTSPEEVELVKADN